MATTYEKIATTTLGSTATDVTFSSISGSYTDLILVCNARATANGKVIAIQLNADTGSNYSLTAVYGNGTTTGTGRQSNITRIDIDQWQYGGLSTQYSTVITNLQNYSNTTTNKTVLTRSGTAGSSTEASVGLWRSTSAITSIKIFISNTGSLDTGSTFTLYGILKA